MESQRAFAEENDSVRRSSPKWLLFHYAIQIGCQLALILGAARFLFRSLPFASSIFVLAATSMRKPVTAHPSRPFAVAVLCLVAVEALHPETQSPLAAIGTLGMYAAVIAPVFWVPRLDIDIAWFKRTFVIVWAFQSLSALVGALQTFFPGSLQPSMSTVYGDKGLNQLTIVLANGDIILRPQGLTDTPGGAAIAGTYAVMLGLGLWLEYRSIWLRSLIALSVAVGTYAIYLCQVRSLLVMVAIAILGTTATQAYAGRTRRLLGTAVMLVITMLAAFGAAVVVGGDATLDRVQTLFAQSPTDIYYSNRGIFLEQTLTDILPQYPLGAGLGRWGMLANYFGTSPTHFLYAEIQWTGWVYDGGLFLPLAYTFAFLSTIYMVWKIGTRRPDLSNWSSTLIGYGLGTVALTFNFAVFTSSQGTDFWLLTTALLTASYKTRPSPKASPA